MTNAEGRVRRVENDLHDAKRVVEKRAVRAPKTDKVNEERLLEARRHLRDGVVVEAFCAKVKVSR